MIEKKAHRHKRPSGNIFWRYSGPNKYKVNLIIYSLTNPNVQSSENSKRNDKEKMCFNQAVRLFLNIIDYFQIYSRMKKKRKANMKLVCLYYSRFYLFRLR